MAISSGTVMKRSTSSGDRPGASLAICTCTLVTSGKASTDSDCKERIPNRIIPNANATTKIRAFKLPRIKASIMGYSNSLRWRSLLR